MKDITLLASFVAPSLRQKEFCGNYAPVLSPLRKIHSGKRNNCAIRSGSVPRFAQPAADMDTASVASSMVGQPPPPQAEPLGVYEAVLPQTETLVGMGFILVLCVALYWVWENQVVPVSRTKLAISKSRGEVKDYLDELKASAPSSSSTMDPRVPSLSSESISPEALVPQTNPAGESSVQAANLDVNGEETKTENPPSISPSTTNDRSFERWLFTDWLQDNKSERKGGRQKEPALPILKDAKWNSGDNPVVVAAFLMLVGLVVTALTERLTSFG